MVNYWEQNYQANTGGSNGKMPLMNGKVPLAFQNAFARILIS